MSLPMQSFNQAQIYGGTFWAVYGDYHQYEISIQNGYHRVGIQALSQAIAHGAMHNSAERDPPPRCHPGTREKAIQDIVRWIEEPNPSSNVLWVNGRAGVGKSALMQTIVELGLVSFGGCFFFRRGAPGCNVKDHLFSTLAYQLAMNVYGMVGPIDWAIMQDYSIPRMSAADQLKRLIMEPLRLFPIPLCPIVIIIDGLDECENTNSQRDILALIGKVAMDLSVAIRFIITSRPEHQICDVFNEEPLFSRTRHLVLDEGYDTAADIEWYLREKLEEIHSRNRDIMPDIRIPWPSKYDFRELIWRASGQFIYAATVIRFVSSEIDFHTPDERLNFILTPGPMQALAFSELDGLYTQILAFYPAAEILIQTLGVVLVLEASLRSLYPTSALALIAAITGFEERKISLVLRALQSITEIWSAPVFDDDEPNGTYIQWVKLSHRSFYDFLSDEARSRSYFIDKGFFLGQVFCRILELATVSIKELRRCGSSITIAHPRIWCEFDIILDECCSTYRSAASKELSCVLNALRSTLFIDQPLLSGCLSQHLCVALIPIIHCVCTAISSLLYTKEKPFDLPKEDDPLQLNQFYADIRNLLDECYHHTLGSAAVDPRSILMHLALDMEESSFYPCQPTGTVLRSPQEIVNICKLPNRGTLRRFVDENSHLIHIANGKVDNIVGTYYYVPRWLCAFFFDPNRSGHLYPASWVIDKCRRAIEVATSPHALRIYDRRLSSFFFTDSESNSEKIDDIPGATHLLEYDPSRNDLLIFLGYLSKIRWFNVYDGAFHRLSTDKIPHWVCTTLASLQPGNIRDAMYNVFTEIILRGMLPALSNYISRVRELGIFEHPNCLGCWKQVTSGLTTFAGFDSEVLTQIVSMCRGQAFFQTFCTMVLESMLLDEGQYACMGNDLPHTCRDVSTHRDSKGNPEINPFEISDEAERDSSNIDIYFSDTSRHYWSFLFTHASASSKCILLAIRSLFRLRHFLQGRFRGTAFIVSEMVDWLKNQTADPQPQDQLIAWMEDANKKIEKAIATWKQIKIDEELRRSAVWASVIQSSQTLSAVANEDSTWTLFARNSPI